MGSVSAVNKNTRRAAGAVIFHGHAPPGGAVRRFSIPRCRHPGAGRQRRGANFRNVSSSSSGRHKRIVSQLKKV